MRGRAVITSKTANIYAYAVPKLMPHFTPFPTVTASQL